MTDSAPFRGSHRDDDDDAFASGSGAVRTTHDIDILVRRRDWRGVAPDLGERFEVHDNQASDRANGVPPDVLFSGDDWGMVLPLPDREAVAECDGAIELAVRDLADVVALLKENAGRVSPSMLEGLHPVVAAELKRILKKLRSRTR